MICSYPAAIRRHSQTIASAFRAIQPFYQPGSSEDQQYDEVPLTRSTAEPAKIAAYGYSITVRPA